MSEKEMAMENLTEEQKAMFKKIEEMSLKKEFQEKCAAIRTTDEAIAILEENGISFTEEQKEQIRKIIAEEAKDKELTDDELAEVAGGWSFIEFYVWFAEQWRRLYYEREDVTKYHML